MQGEFLEFMVKQEQENLQFLAQYHLLFLVKPQKKEQDVETLRSHHIREHDDVLAEVELIFEIGKSQYFIRRRPTQQRPNRRGDGTVAEQHIAWLFDVTGIAIEDILNGNDGKIIAEKKVSDVNHEIKQRLNYGAEQFRQIVLLPQGKFERFLIAKHDERFNILKELFNVSLYEKLREKIQSDEKKMAEEIRLLNSECNQYFEQTETVDLQELQNKISIVQQAKEQCKKELSDAERKLNKVDTSLSNAQIIETKFVERDKTYQTFETLKKKSADIEENKKQLKAIKDAESLKDIDSALQSAKQNLEDSKQAQDDAEKYFLEAQENIKAKKETLENLTSEDKNQLQAKHESDLKDRLRYKEVLQRVDPLHAKKIKQIYLLNAEERKYKDKQEQRDSNKEKLEKKQQELNNATEAEKTRLEITPKITQLENRIEQAKKYTLSIEAKKQQESKLKEVEDILSDIKEEFSDKEKKFQQAEQKLADMQALHLANKLSKGKACPVCGSTEHPSPAKGDAHSKGLDKYFREAKNELEDIQAKQQKRQEIVASEKAILQEKSKQLQELPKPEQPIEQLQNQKQELDEQLQMLGEAVIIKDLKEEIQNIKNLIHDLNEKCEELRESRDTAKTALTRTQDKIDIALSEIPEELQDGDILQDKIQQLEDAIHQRKEKLELAKKEKSDADLSLTKAKADKDNAIKNYKNASNECDKKQKIMETRLKEKHLTVEQYDAYKVKISNISAMEQVIKKYDEQYQIAKADLSRLDDEVKDKQRPDIQQLEQDKEMATVKKDEIITNSTKLQEQINNLNKILQKIEKVLQDIITKEKEYKPLIIVADAFSGKGINHSKIPLETFAIAEMLDKVLQSASLRLRKMTDERYRLQRKIDAKGGTRKKGLDIEIHDTHTGKERPVTTLSGGESFMAALSLALGLSDIVESTIGGIQLDAIFIDEGFGHLDEATLEHVLQTLQNIVGGSRAVGIISHVDLVQQAIPNGFKIERKNDGSSTINLFEG